MHCYLLRLKTVLLFSFQSFDFPSVFSLWVCYSHICCGGLVPTVCGPRRLGCCLCLSLIHSKSDMGVLAKERLLSPSPVCWPARLCCPSFRVVLLLQIFDSFQSCSLFLPSFGVETSCSILFPVIWYCSSPTVCYYSQCAGRHIHR